MRFGLAILVLFFSAALPFGRQLLLGAGLLDDDVFLQSLPAWTWLSHAMRSGESWLWSPEIMGGFPIAFTQYPFLYPPDLLLIRLLPPVHAYAWSLVLHLLLAGVLTYLYCRIVGLRGGPALLAAVSYQMSSEVVAGSSGFEAHSAFVLPGCLLAVELLLRRGWRYGPVLSLVVASALLGGHPQLVLLGLGGGACYALFRLTMLARSSGTGPAGRLAGTMALAAALGVAGAAVRLLPTWEVLQLSTRAAGLPQEAGTSGSLAIQGLLVGYLLPLSRMESLPWGSPGYAGPVVVVLVAFGIRGLAGRALGRFLLCLAIVAGLLSLGDATPLYTLFQVPPFSFFREPSRLTLLSTFSFALLAGMALDSLWPPSKSSEPNRARMLMISAVLAGVLVLALFVLGGVFQFGAGPMADGLRYWGESRFVDLLNPLRPRMALALLSIPAVLLVLSLAARGVLSRPQTEWILLLTTAAVLVPVAALLNPAIDPTVMARAPQTTGFLEAGGGEYRVLGHRAGMRLYNHLRYYGPTRESASTDDLRYRFQAEMLAPVTNLGWGIASVDGYEQLHSRYQELVLRYIDSERLSDWVTVSGKWAHLTMEERLRVLRMLNVRYLLSGVDLTSEAPLLELAGRVEVAPGLNSRAAPSIYVLENPDPLPRYYLVSQAREFDSDADVLDAVALGEVDPGTAVLLSRNEAASGMSLLPDAGSPATAQGRVELTSARNDEVVLEVVTDSPGYLVTSDAYWPGWRAFVDGIEAPVLRANVSGRAVWLDGPGTHTVVLRFDPPGFALGRGISVAAGLIVLLWLAAALLRIRLPRISSRFV